MSPLEDVVCVESDGRGRRTSRYPDSSWMSPITMSWNGSASLGRGGPGAPRGVRDQTDRSLVRAGSAASGETTDNSGHEQSRQVQTNRSSATLHGFDLGRKNGRTVAARAPWAVAQFRAGEAAPATIWAPAVGRLKWRTRSFGHEVVRLAVASEAQGGSSSAFVSEIIEDWCGTPWPRKWPWPGPRPDTEAEGPSPEPWGVQTARVIGAVIFASAASRLSSGDLRTAFDDGADRLVETALVD